MAQRSWWDPWKYCFLLFLSFFFFFYFLVFPNDGSHFLSLKNQSDEHKDQNECVIWNPSIRWKRTRVRYLQLVLLIMDFFSEWVTKELVNALKENNILLVGSFQTWRISTNPSNWQWMENWQTIMQNQFCEWYIK